MRSMVLPLLLLILLGACGRTPYPGYKPVDEGVYMQLISLGDGASVVTDEDSVWMRFRASLPGDPAGSLYSTERRYLAADLRQGALVPVFARMHEGDSMSVIARATAFPWAVITGDAAPAPPDTIIVQLELAMRSIRTVAMQQADRERMRVSDPSGFEQRLITAYLDGSADAWTRWGTSHLHYRTEGIAVDTNRVKRGETVTITYSGRRLEDGQVFDDTHRNGQPFTFRFGDHDQVIKGIETAVHLLREGQRGWFILPSDMAFGQRGISGIIDPWSPVVYEVALERIERVAAVSARDQ